MAGFEWREFLGTRVHAEQVFLAELAFGGLLFQTLLLGLESVKIRSPSDIHLTD